MLPLTRFTIVAIMSVAWFCAPAMAAEREKPHWTFTEEQLRLFNPPLDADAQTMLQWTRSLERPIPEKTHLWGGSDKYREQVGLMRIMVSRAILASDPPLELEQSAWRTLWFPYWLLCRQNLDEWLPKMKTVYDELVSLSRKKGEILDKQTILYLSTRREFLCDGEFLSEVVKRDKDFLVYGEEILEETGSFLRKDIPFDNLKRELYRINASVYHGMSAVDEKYEKIYADFKAEMKQLVIQNEDRLQSPWWYELLLPEEPFDTLEKQAEAHRLIEKFQKLIDTDEETQRFTSDPDGDSNIAWLYRFQAELFETLIEADRENLPKLQAWLTTLEKKCDPQSYIASFIGYCIVWQEKLQDFAQEGGTNDDLVQVFDAMSKLLDLSDDYDRVGNQLRFITGYDPFKKSPEQQKLFMNWLELLIIKMEMKEQAWKDAGKGMMEESYAREMRDYLDSLRAQW